MMKNSVTKTMFACEVCNGVIFTEIQEVYTYHHQLDPDIQMKCIGCGKVQKVY